MYVVLHTTRKRMIGQEKFQQYSYVSPWCSSYANKIIVESILLSEGKDSTVWYSMSFKEVRTVRVLKPRIFYSENSFSTDVGKSLF